MRYGPSAVTMQRWLMNHGEATLLTRRTLLAAPVVLTFSTGVVDAKKRKSNKPKKSKLKRDAPLPILTDLAMHHQHGWADEGKPISELVAMYRRGEIISCICGSISHTGVAILRDAGYAARVVGVVTQQPFNGNDGHIMLEVWVAGAWRLYCLDWNRRAVDSKGRGVSLIDQVRAGAGRIWEPIAQDAHNAPDFDDVATPWSDWTLEQLDARVFGTPWIVLKDDATEAFHDATDRTRLEAMGHRYLNKKQWKRLTGKP
jgi:hypothetical protein